MKVRALSSEVHLLFDADEAAGTALFSVQHAQAFVDKYKLGQFGEMSQESERGPIWAAVRGEISPTANKTVRIEQVQGSQTDVLVLVDGETPDADFALDSIWKTLCELSNSPVRPVDDVGTRCYRTTAVIEFDKTFEAIFPAAAFLREQVHQAFDGSPFRPIQPLQHRFSFEFPLSLGHRRLARKFTLEPRLNAKRESTLWTQSPLPSAQHMAILEKLAKLG